MKKSVLIIGSGVGGLSTAVRLLSRGCDVKVYERYVIANKHFLNRLFENPVDFFKMIICIFIQAP